MRHFVEVLASGDLDMTFWTEHWRTGERSQRFRSF